MIPKRDELLAVAATFAFGEEPDARLHDKYDTWIHQVDDLVVQFVLVGAQGASHMTLATSTAINDLDPDVLVCLGTAAGREGSIDYVDVVLATRVLDASEWRARPGGELQPQWDDAHAPTEDALADIDDCVKSDAFRDSFTSHFANGTTSLSDQSIASLAIVDPKVVDAWTATTPFLHQDRKFLKKLWNIHARLRAADMETSGFIHACQDGPRVRPWFVIRSISDYGTPESKRDELRPLAGVAAAAACRALIEKGLRRSHPLRVNPRELNKSGLSEANYLSQMTISEYLAEEIPIQFGLTLDPKTLMTELSVYDLAALVRPGSDLESARSALDGVRERYFTKKYINYEDQSDVRNFTGGAWTQDVASACRYLGVQPEASDVIYVGIGTGRDVPQVLPAFSSLTGVDLSLSMLHRAKELTPQLNIQQGCAETLARIEDDSFDLYLSLRTFQSSLFDTGAALRQAVRVLRPGGSIILSIPGGFVDRDANGELRFIPGLHLPGSNFIDRARPRRIADRLLTQMDNLLFERVGHHQQGGDYYVYGRRPGRRP